LFGIFHTSHTAPPVRARWRRASHLPADRYSDPTAWIIERKFEWWFKRRDESEVNGTRFPNCPHRR
jgi:hypothetical protein